MRRHARSESRRRIVRKLGGEVLPGTAVAEIGSRVFPLRAPSAASMPSVGTRHSTRVFVSRAKEAPRGVDLEASARVLRSGKRLVPSKPIRKRAIGEEGDGDAWLRLLWWKEDDKKGVVGVADGWHRPRFLQETSQSLDSSDGKSFGFVYSRKRPRPGANGVVSMSSSTADSELKKDKKYGIVFSRKQRRKRIKVEPLVQEVSGETGVEAGEHQEIREWKHTFLDSAADLVWRSGTLGVDFLTSVGGPVVLAVLIESCHSSSSYRFSRLLISILKRIRMSRLEIRKLAAFLLSGSMAGVFSLNGIHFLPVRHRKNNVMLGTMAFGSCMIYGAREFVPLLSLDFSALPSYFKSLNISIMLQSLYMPAVLMRYLTGLRTTVSMAIGIEEKYSPFYVERCLREVLDAGSLIPPVQRSRSNSIKGALQQVPQNIDIVHGSKLQKPQRKRSSLRHSQSYQPSFMRLRTGVLRSNRRSVWRHSEAKASSSLEHIQVNALDASSSNFFSSIHENDALTPGSHGKHKRSATKSPVERIKEKMALAEVKQNIDSVHCKASILVIDTDRCWREEGAHVMLEMSVSNKWCIAVKVQQMTRILHKPLDMKPCIVNRFTHAYMWGVEDGWKLEFLDRWDWILFKELYMECQLRSSQDTSVKLIPVPGVREVSDYVGNVAVPFLQPDAYIKMRDDEVERALARQPDSLYEMDSGDEKWLEQLNSNSPDVENSNSRHISKDDLEIVISTLEKDACNNFNEIPNVQRVLDLCHDLLREDILVAVYDYWLKKRNKKGAPLVRVFQGPPLRRGQLIQKLGRSFLRKKRSFKRPRIQTGRVKSEILVRDGAKEEALRRVQEAENAAKSAAELAIHLRSRAQMLMENAELAAYRSLMALRIAEALQMSEAPELGSYFLD